MFFWRDKTRNHVNLRWTVTLSDGHSDPSPAGSCAVTIHFPPSPVAIDSFDDRLGNTSSTLAPLQKYNQNQQLLIYMPQKEVKFFTMF